MDRGAWWATVHGTAKSGTGLRDSHFHFHAFVTRDTLTDLSFLSFHLFVSILPWDSIKYKQ